MPHDVVKILMGHALPSDITVDYASGDVDPEDLRAHLDEIDAALKRFYEAGVRLKAVA